MIKENMLEDRSSLGSKTNSWAYINDYGVDRLESQQQKRPQETHQDEEDAHARKISKQPDQDDGLELRLAYGDRLIPPPNQQHANPREIHADGLELGLGTLFNPMIALEQSKNQHDSYSDSNESSLICAIGRDNSIDCLLRCPRYTYAYIASLNRSLHELINSGELYKIRSMNRVIEHWVYFSCSMLKWEAFDPPISKKWMNLPMMDTDLCVQFSSKESLAVGTELLVLGKDLSGQAIYKYSLLTNSWSSGQPMNSPRCLFGSASVGQIAIFAGGIDPRRNIMEDAESYNGDTGTWEKLPSMLKARNMCSGVFMDGKFYVIGGVPGPGLKPLTCGEEYDLDTKKWTEIPNMSPLDASHVDPNMAPPLVGVVDNEFYAADCVEMALKK